MMDDGFCMRTPWTQAREAAQIVHAWLQEELQPGAVYFLPSAKRFRLCALSYVPNNEQEVLIGIYNTQATLDMIAEDFEIATSSAPSEG